jgi:hypothetical protein
MGFARNENVTSTRTELDIDPEDPAITLSNLASRKWKEKEEDVRRLHRRLGPN